MKRRTKHRKSQRGGIISDQHLWNLGMLSDQDFNNKLIRQRINRQQAGAGLATAFRSLPNVLRRLGPQLARLTRRFRTPKTGLQKYKSHARNLAKGAHKQVKGVHKQAKKTITKKNLKRAGKAGAIALGTGAIAGIGQHIARRLLPRDDS